MSESCHHLAYSERCRIQVLLKRGLSKREVAREPGRAASTISREVLRNRGQRGYRHKQAEGKARRLRCRAR